MSAPEVQLAAGTVTGEGTGGGKYRWFLTVQINFALYVWPVLDLLPTGKPSDGLGC
jgi:hypothetical protein